MLNYMKMKKLIFLKNKNKINSNVIEQFIEKLNLWKMLILKNKFLK